MSDRYVDRKGYRGGPLVSTRRSPMPCPSPKWQLEEYVALMGQPPSTSEDPVTRRQFDYTPRSKYGRELLAKMVEEAGLGSPAEEA